MSSQLIIAEANNVSYNDNTNTEFRIRLPYNLKFSHPHEIGVLDISIPVSVFNIERNAYFALCIHGEKLFSEPIETGESVSNPSTEYKYIKYVKGEKYRKSTVIKVPILPGFFPSTTDLLKNVLKEGIRLIQKSNIKTIPHPPQEKMAETVAGLQEGVYLFQNDILEAPDGIKQLLKEAFKSAINQFSFIKQTLLLQIAPPPKTRDLDFTCLFSSDIGFLLGFPEKNIIQIPKTMKKKIFSPFLCRTRPINLFYLYCDEINHTIINNYSTNLLKVVAYDSDLKFGDIFTTSFHNPTYVELNTLSLDHLSFKLRDPAGQKVKFQNGTSAVRITLELRPIRTTPPR